MVFHYYLGITFIRKEIENDIMNSPHTKFTLDSTKKDTLI